MVNALGNAEVISFVPVREGSKGLLGKNIRPLAGVPLYMRAVLQGTRVAGSCIISTDIAAILNSPVPDHCRLLSRNRDLCGDDVAMDAVIANMIEHFCLGDHIVILLLPATSPLRNDADITAVLDLHASGDFDLVLSVTAADSGILKYGMISENQFIPVARPQFCFANRQSLPEIFKPNGAVFAFSAGAFRRNGGLATSRIGAVEMPASRSVDIDTLADFIEIEDGLNLLKNHYQI
jgi:N-acylneuraminate cytidylyltransferase